MAAAGSEDRKERQGCDHPHNSVPRSVLLVHATFSPLKETLRCRRAQGHPAHACARSGATQILNSSAELLLSTDRLCRAPRRETKPTARSRYIRNPQLWWGEDIDAGVCRRAKSSCGSRGRGTAVTTLGRQTAFVSSLSMPTAEHDRWNCMWCLLLLRGWDAKIASLSREPAPPCMLITLAASVSDPVSNRKRGGKALASE